MKNNFDYKAWYEKNKDSIQAQRRRRYQTDKAYREKILKSNREGKKQQGFSARQVAHGAGLTHQDILALEKYRIIPDVRKDGMAKRFYSDHQRNLIRWGAEQFIVDQNARWVKNRLDLSALKEYFKQQNFKEENNGYKDG